MSLNVTKTDGSKPTTSEQRLAEKHFGTPKTTEQIEEWRQHAVQNGAAAASNDMTPMTALEIRQIFKNATTEEQVHEVIVTKFTVETSIKLMRKLRVWFPQTYSDYQDVNLTASVRRMPVQRNCVIRDLIKSTAVAVYTALQAPAEMIPVLPCILDKDAFGVDLSFIIMFHWDKNQPHVHLALNEFFQ